MGGICDTIGSQFIITIDSGEGRALDGMDNTDNNFLNLEEKKVDEQKYFSLGVVSEDENDVLTKMNTQYCDRDGRPYADVRIIRAHVLEDPYEDPPGMNELLESKKITLLETSDLPGKHAICARWLASSSPKYDRPPCETVEMRISVTEALDEEGETKRHEELQEKEDKSRAIVLEMLGDLPAADMKPPENVLFVCKLNSVTEDEDLQLIFSRFDPDVKAEIIRDSITGDSLQYAFIEFTTKEQCTEAYFKMDNALIDDRRIKVDFSQSVAKVWNKYTERKRMNGNKASVRHRSHEEHRQVSNVKRMKVEQQEQRSNVRVEKSDHRRSEERTRKVNERIDKTGRHHRLSRSSSSSNSATTSSSYSRRRRRSRNERRYKSKHKESRHRKSRRREKDDGRKRNRRRRHESDEERRENAKRRHKSSHRSHRRSERS